MDFGFHLKAMETTTERSKDAVAGNHVYRLEAPHVVRKKNHNLNFKQNSSNIF